MSNGNCPQEPVPPLRRTARPRARHADRRSVLHAHPRRVRRRGDQDRGARRGRPAAHLAQAVPGHLSVVVRAVAQQEVGHRQPQAPAGPGDRAPAGARTATSWWKTSVLARWRNGGLGYDQLSAGQPGPHHGAPVRLRPDRPVSRPARLRRHRRGDGRDPLRHRLSRTGRRCAPASAWAIQRRGHVRRDRRLDGAACARRQRRARPGGGRGACTRPCSA